MSKFVQIRVIVAALGLSLLGTAQAEDVIDLTGVVPSVEQVQNGLLPEQACQQLRENGFKCMGFKPAVRFSMPSTYFEIGSAQLPAELRKQLDVFATVLKTVPQDGTQFLVTGHADASGGEQINVNLSQARASAVKEYLAQQGVSKDLIVTSGKGSSALAVPQNPYSPRNRRVEIGRAN